MLEMDFYGDSLCILAFSLEFGARVTVLLTSELTELRFRHNRTMDAADIVLVLTPDEHYNAASKS
jgi:hypothetical protein